MVDSQAKKGRISFKDAMLSKYSFDDDQQSDENLCFIHISGSPKRKGTFVFKCSVCLLLAISILN